MRFLSIIISIGLIAHITADDNNGNKKKKTSGGVWQRFQRMMGSVTPEAPQPKTQAKTNVWAKDDSLKIMNRLLGR